MPLKIAPDKWRHFYAGLPMGAVLQGVSSLFFPGQLVIACSMAFVLVVAISYGFELFSKITGMGHYDIWDAVASVIGGVLGMGAAVLLIIYY